MAPSRVHYHIAIDPLSPFEERNHIDCTQQPDSAGTNEESHQLGVCVCVWVCFVMSV